MDRPTILLNPGPVTLSERVRSAMLREDQCHREPDFASLMMDIKKRLVQVYPDSTEAFDAVMITGSGTCSVEAMLSTFAPLETKTLVVTNGVYGERMVAMLDAQKKPYESTNGDWSCPMDLYSVEKFLEQDDNITHIAAVHNETTTGRLNDIESLAKLCKSYDKRLLLDAVSSFGAEEIDFSDWPLDAVAATANKCLHGVPGIAFVMSRELLFSAESSYSNTLYLDLHRYYMEQRSGFSPFTPAVHACFALHESLKELEENGGVAARNQRYRTLSATIRAALNKLGIRSFLDESDYSSMISSFYLPENWDYPALHDELRTKGFVIYAGQAGLFHSIFRIANMGDIHDADIERLLAAFTDLMKK